MHSIDFISQNQDIPAFLLLDMHSHPLERRDASLLREELNFRCSRGIFTCFSAGTPQEWKFLSKGMDAAAGSVYNRISFGIHPWYADQWNPLDWMDLYRACNFIGEIGLDTLWCNVPYETQVRCFEKQLAIAADLHKPVLLHTKNCEAAIAERIRDFPYPVCVHWYSGDLKTLETYVSLGCYFTFSADAALFAGCNPDRKSHLFPNATLHEEMAVRISRMLEIVPLDRVFTETDGVEAIRWAMDIYGSAAFMDLRSISGSPLSVLTWFLQKTSALLADAHHLTGSKFISQLYQNLSRFLGD